LFSKPKYKSQWQKVMCGLMHITLFSALWLNKELAVYSLDPNKYDMSLMTTNASSKVSPHHVLSA